jgi:hypothetical protein
MRIQLDVLGALVSGVVIPSMGGTTLVDGAVPPTSSLVLLVVVVVVGIMPVPAVCLI